MAMVVADMRLDDQPIIFVNDAFLALTGYERHEVLGRNCRFLQGPDTDRLAVAEMRNAVREGRDAAVEMLNYRKDGRPFWNAVFISPVKDDHGETLYFFGAQRDVSERKRSEFALREAHSSLETAVQSRSDALQQTLEQRMLLLHEVEHRVKNNLQLINSLIQFQARRTSDPQVRAALREVQERVGAVSTVHRRLFQSGDAAYFDVAQFLRDMADDAFGRAGRDDLCFDVSVEPVQVPAAIAAPLALIINEIFSRTLRTAPEQGGPQLVRIAARPSGAGRFVIELSDDGPSSRTALDAALAQPANIIDILRRQLGADIRWDGAAVGLHAVIDVPTTEFR